jgi:uncharacterized membrane protein SpoIIM required for sporulation
MALSDSVSAAVAVLRRRPSDLLPLYLLGAAVPMIARTIPFLGLFAVYLYLEWTGRLDAALAEFETGIPEAPDPESDPEAFEAWMEELLPIVQQLLPFEVGIFLFGTILLTVALGIVLFAAVSAGQLAACYGRLRDDRGLVIGLAGARRFWLRFLGLYVLEFVLWVVVGSLAIASMALLGGVLAAAAGTGLVALLVVLPALFFAVVVVATIRAVFAFAPVAIVVDDASVFESLSRAVAFIRREPVGALFYYVVAVGSTVAMSVVTGVLSIVGVVTIATVFTTLLLFPFLDLLKTALYGGSRGRISPPQAPDRSLRGQFTDGLRRGWTETFSFVRATPLLHTFVVASAVVTFWAGWEVAEPLVGTVDTSIAARLEGHIAPAAALEFFGNNWMVAYTTAYAGLAFAVPAFVSLAFNGFIMGIYARLEVDLIELVAFVIPHGIIEVPAIFIATALGLWLGVVGWQAARGRADQNGVVDALERAFWVVIGLGILLAVAGFVEGFVSPYYYELFL